MQLFFSLIFLLCSALSCAASVLEDMAAENRQLESQVEGLFTPGVDLLDVKIAVDAIAGGTSVTTKSDLYALSSKLIAMVDQNASDSDKLKILKQFIYEQGDWNGGRAFSYDHADPLGSNPANKHLAHYLQSRRGNCITMPILFAILGKRIGLDMTLSLAPLHLLVKYTDDTGAVWNLEPTSGGGFTRDAWYRKELPMSDAAIANGVYLRPLNDEQSTAAIASFLVEHFITAAKPDLAINTYTRAASLAAELLGGIEVVAWVKYFNENFLSGIVYHKHHIGLINDFYRPVIPGLQKID